MVETQNQIEYFGEQKKSEPLSLLSIQSWDACCFSQVA